MPELPEVETTRRHIERLFKGRRLVLALPDEDDLIVFDDASPLDVKKALEGAKVIGSGRRGKYFWLELDRRPWPVFHFGMTGNIETRLRSKGFIRAWGGAKLFSEPKMESLKAKFLPFCKLRVVADNDTEFAYTDPRRFGRIRLSMDPKNEVPISKLGFDPLHDFPLAGALHKILLKRRAPIKTVLMDQKVFAGVGNWIADEVLFQAGLSPYRLGSKLVLSESTRIRAKLLAIVKKSIDVDANYDLYPKSWLFHHRWGKEKEAMTSKKMKLTFDTIGGRTTAWVPEVQK